MNPLFLNSFFGDFDEKFFLVFFITNNKRACQKQAIILKMKKSFLAFLVSEKLDAKLSDNLLKSAFFIGGLSWRLKRRENDFKALSIFSRK
ncbi:hypothetical protein HPHPP28B_1286 [Helicobacter pylori Hp P-28b]|nr:hypothetical protein HPHPP28B_1286 [Helicobacter pylori Hp P-28b]